ncbi:ral GTPase-activating protein subunit beta isoform X1 [Cimex lectularius]|uniref:Rap-GAP domain-containing protein n=2 Tax=Cimex lectularius TaxID=79782 RepID=A0A8I6S7G4_CIMLE|nr:ral GTPase-activating protein subunit beta isoform X1 [Cimex lectularius]
MNLGIFNRVNLKESEGGGMYSEWASLANIVRHESADRESVLNKFPVESGKDVALIIVKDLIKNIGLTQAPVPSPLVSDKDVQWCMEVICYGLSLPLVEHDAIRDCVHIYCDWLTVLHPSPTTSVPKPLLDDPNLYARKIIAHLHNLFIPRKGEVWPFLYSDLGADTIKRQAVLCHRVLRTLQQAAHCSTIMSHETWEALLIFMLAINETLLATPTTKDDVGDQLCERVLSVLFEVWLIACGKSFPSPPLWRTLREMAMTWRHRGALISTWAKVCLALTHRLIGIMFPPNFPKHQYYENDSWTVPNDLTDETVAQVWFRLLHTLGSPVDLCRPQVISQTPKFLQYAMVLDMDPSSHPCLTVLPINFLIAIKGISNIVDAFLGVMSEQLVLTEEDQKKEIPTPPPHRRPAKSFSVSSVSHKGSKSSAALIGVSGRALSASSASSSSTSSITTISGSWDISSISAHILAPGRPKCNSILHLFGEWLFEAAQTGTGLYANPNLSRENNSRQSGSLSSGQNDSLESETSISLMTSRYQAGRATALASLCRIFCSKKTGEQILPVYYARFYLVLLHGLKLNDKRDVEESLVSILMNSADLLRLDLDGIQILVPHILQSLERVLPDKDLTLKPSVNMSEFRRACINILLSILPLPLHFPNLVVRELISTHSDKPHLTFGQLKSRVMNLLINALQVETDPHNTHLLLGGLLVMVQDAASIERLMGENQLPQLTSYSSSSSDSANSLFVKATYLVCHRLISSWKGDLGISLAALELLCGLANSGIKDIDHVEWERGMKWVCDYIVYQCWRPPQAHSKDLHSSVVAAFTTVSVWIMAQPSLLQNKQCLHNVLEVVELGLSGSKSQGKRRDEPIKMKDEKELKPVSMRVRDAAESLLTTILEHAGHFPTMCGPESISTLVDENILLRQCSTKSASSFKYFVLHNTILMALLDDPLENHEEPRPVVNVILRGGFGRHAWSFQLRQLPRHRSNASRGKGQSGPGRPVFLNTNPQVQRVQHKFFPDSINKIPRCAVEHSIPVLDGDVSEISHLLKQQKELETEARLMAENVKKNSQECHPPRVCGEFQTTRLFLSHFGFLHKLEGGKCSLLALDSKKDGFFKDVEMLDRMEPRTSDTCHVFYVRAGQSHYQDILANVESNCLVSNSFLQVLKTFGSPKKVTGSSQDVEGGSGGGWFSGHKHVLYWADSMSQVTFIVPTLQPLPKVRHQQIGNEDKAKRQLTTYPVFIVWLENIEDHIDFPLEEMINHTGCGQEGWSSQNCTIIFIHALQSGLFRIKLQPSTNRPTVATPLVDGIVVGKNKVGAFIRQTALNICRRKRLDNESYQPPHTRRRLKIQEISTKYELKDSRAGLLTSLFQ